MKKSQKEIAITDFEAKAAEILSNKQVNLMGVVNVCEQIGELLRPYTGDGSQAAIARLRAGAAEFASHKDIVGYMMLTAIADNWQISQPVGPAN